MAQISSTEANRTFSKLLAKVRKGQTAEITVHGEVVAKMVPVAKRNAKTDAAEKKQWDAFMERLRQQPVLDLPKIKREELYD